MGSRPSDALLETPPSAEPKPSGERGGYKLCWAGASAHLAHVAPRCPSSRRSARSPSPAARFGGGRRAGGRRETAAGRGKHARGGGPEDDAPLRAELPERAARRGQPRGDELALALRRPTLRSARRAASSVCAWSALSRQAACMARARARRRRGGARRQRVPPRRAGRRHRRRRACGDRRGRGRPARRLPEMIVEVRAVRAGLVRGRPPRPGRPVRRLHAHMAAARLASSDRATIRGGRRCREHGQAKHLTLIWVPSRRARSTVAARSARPSTSWDSLADEAVAFCVPVAVGAGSAPPSDGFGSARTRPRSTLMFTTRTRAASPTRLPRPHHAVARRSSRADVLPVPLAGRDEGATGDEERGGGGSRYRSSAARCDLHVLSAVGLPAGNAKGTGVPDAYVRAIHPAERGGGRRARRGCADARGPDRHAHDSHAPKWFETLVRRGVDRDPACVAQSARATTAQKGPTRTTRGHAR